MRKFFILSVIVLSISGIMNAQGLTEDFRWGTATPVVGETAEIDVHPSGPVRFSSEKPAEFMTTIDSLNVEVTLGPGEYAAVYVDVAAGTLGYTPSDIPIDTLLEPWVISAPVAMQLQLRRNLFGIPHMDASNLAGMLAVADPLWLDELYFCLGHLPQEVLESSQISTLLIENVRDIYAHDSLLPYVEIVDQNATGGPYHRTIARYFTTDTGMAGIDTVEIDADMYYEFVLFPKITDEIPLYINPATGNMSDPPAGKFWRNWFWGVAETVFVEGDTLKCWPLGDSLAVQTTVWNGLHNTAADNGAVGRITKWIKDILVFTSDAERPHQPVRIYGKHIGRCGEHADITTAAYRVALIPCRNISAWSSDHTWNEFWTGYRWAATEPVNTYVDAQWVYADGWGKEFATVFVHTGEDLMLPVTDNYSHEIAYLDLYVRDPANRPVDGAEVKIASQESGGVYYDCLLITNSEGMAYGMVGDNKELFWRVDSDAGGNPADPSYVTSLVSLTADGAVYPRSITVPDFLPHIIWTEEESPETTAYLGARLQPVGEFITYTGPTDDMTTTYHLWSDSAYGFDLFALTDDEYAIFETGGTFAAIAMDNRVGSGSFEVPVGDENYWVVVSNIENLKNTLVAELTVMLHDSSTGVAESKLPRELSVSVYPNPFNSTVRIAVDIPTSDTYCNTPLRIEIFDIAGRKVNRLSSKVKRGRDNTDSATSSPYEMFWTPGKSVGSGVFLIRAEVGDKSVNRRIVYVK